MYGLRYYIQYYCSTVVIPSSTMADATMSLNIALLELAKTISRAGNFAYAIVDLSPHAMDELLTSSKR